MSVLILHQKNNLDWEPAYLVFIDEATFYGSPIRNRRWIAPNQRNHISVVKSIIKIKVLGAVCYSRKIDLHFYKEKTKSDVYINILKRYIPKIENTCVLTWNSSSSEAKPRLEYGEGSIPLEVSFRTSQLAVEFSDVWSEWIREAAKN